VAVQLQAKVYEVVGMTPVEGAEEAAEVVAEDS
jgi:hypothetical protein